MIDSGWLEQCEACYFFIFFSQGCCHHARLQPEHWRCTWFGKCTTLRTDLTKLTNYATFFSMDMSFCVGGLCMLAIGIGLKPFILLLKSTIPTFADQESLVSLPSFFYADQPGQWWGCRLLFTKQSIAADFHRPTNKNTNTHTHTLRLNSHVMIMWFQAFCQVGSNSLKHVKVKRPKTSYEANPMNRTEGQQF